MSVLVNYLTEKEELRLKYTWLLEKYVYLNSFIKSSLRHSTLTMPVRNNGDRKNGFFLTCLSQGWRVSEVCSGNTILNNFHIHLYLVFCKSCQQIINLFSLSSSSLPPIVQCKWPAKFMYKLRSAWDRKIKLDNHLPVLAIPTGLAPLPIRPHNEH